MIGLPPHPAIPHPHPNPNPHPHHPIFFIISQHWDETVHWNPPQWKTWNHLSCIVNAIAADGMVVQGARSSATMILSWFSWNILVWVPKGLPNQYICTWKLQLAIPVPIYTTAPNRGKPSAGTLITTMLYFFQFRDCYLIEMHVSCYNEMFKMAKKMIWEHFLSYHEYCSEINS